MTIETTMCPDCEGSGIDDTDGLDCMTCSGNGSVQVDENGEMVEDEPI